MAEQLLPGHISARQALARLQATNPAEFARQYAGKSFDQIIASDRTLQTMVGADPRAAAQLRGLNVMGRAGVETDAGTMMSADFAYTGGDTPRYSTSELERIARERHATMGASGAQALATADYNDKLRHAEATSTWWDENPDGGQGDDWFGKMIKGGVGVLATVAVVATAGAAAGVFAPAVGAGNAAAAAAAAEAGWAGIASNAVAGVNAAGISGAAASSALNAAVTAGVGTAAASGGTAAAAVGTSLGSMQVVTITGAKLATTGLSAAAQAAIGATAVGATMAAAGTGGAAPGEMQTVEIKGERPAPNDLASGFTPGQLAIPAAASALPYLTPGAAVDPAPGALPINRTLLETLPAVGATAANPSTTNPLKGIPSAVGDLLNGPVGTALTGVALTTALGGLTTKDMPVDAGLNSAVGSLDSNADAQMKEWNEWMYPQLKSALANNKAATDQFVGQANANAGQIEDMGASARGLGDLYSKRNNDVYIPLADKIIADANQFNKAGFAEQQSGLAVGDLSSAYAAQRQQQAQSRAQYGIDPSSGRAMAIDAAGGVSHAANTAAAATRARMAAEELWGKKQVDALGTSTALNANAAGINASYNNAAGMYSGATGLRQQGVKATSDYFTNASELAKTSTSTYAGANNAYSASGQLGLGRAKIESDRYIAEQEGRGKVIGAGLQAINSNGGVTKTVGDAIDTGGKIWNVIKGIWE